MKIGDQVAVTGKVTEIIENEDGREIRIRFESAEFLSNCLRFKEQALQELLAPNRERE